MIILYTETILNGYIPPSELSLIGLELLHCGNIVSTFCCLDVQKTHVLIVYEVGFLQC